MGTFRVETGFIPPDPVGKKESMEDRILNKIDRQRAAKHRPVITESVSLADLKPKKESAGDLSAGQSYEEKALRFFEDFQVSSGSPIEYFGQTQGIHPARRQPKHQRPKTIEKRVA